MLIHVLIVISGIVAAIILFVMLLAAVHVIEEFLFLIKKLFPSFSRKANCLIRKIKAWSIAMFYCSIILYACYLLGASIFEFFR